MRVLLALFLLGITSARAAAQAQPVTIPARDVTVSIGWAGAEHTMYEGPRWQGSLSAGISAGVYWNDHLKSELEGSWNKPGTRQVYETIERQGGYTYAVADYRATDVRVGFVQLYQFGRNEWVHPYIGVGADVVHRTAARERPPQSRTIFIQNRNTPVEIPGAREETASVFLQAVLKTGAKMYVGDKAFFNTELKLGLREGVDHVVWKLGLGVDF